MDTGKERDFTLIDMQRGQMHHALEQTARFYEDGLWSSAGKHAREYLTGKRKFSEETLKKFRIGFIPKGCSFVMNRMHHVEGIPLDTLYDTGLLGKKEETGRYYDFFWDVDRVVFPFIKGDGKVIGFTARRIDEEKDTKYLHTRNTQFFNKSQFLYNIDEALKAARYTDQLILVEGTTSILQAYQKGILNMAAPCGTALTREHLEMLKKRMPDLETILCFDGDDPGLNAAERAVEKLLGYNLKVCELPPGMDPDDVLRKQSKAIFDMYIGMKEGVFDFLIKRKSEEQDLTSAEGRIVTARKLKNAVDLVPDDQKLIYIGTLAERLGVPRGDVEPIFAKNINIYSNAAVSNTESPDFIPSIYQGISHPRNSEFWQKQMVRVLVSLARQGLNQRGGLQEMFTLGETYKAPSLLIIPEGRASYDCLKLRLPELPLTELDNEDCLFDSGARGKIICLVRTCSREELNPDLILDFFDTSRIAYPSEGALTLSHKMFKDSIFELYLAKIDRDMRRHYMEMKFSIKSVAHESEIIMAVMAEAAKVEAGRINGNGKEKDRMELKKEGEKGHTETKPITIK